MINEFGICVCDHCKENIGLFDSITGNHPICDEAAELRARLADLEKIAEAAEIFSNYFDCIMPEFDDDQYVGDVGFQAKYFRELHSAYEKYKETHK